MTGVREAALRLLCYSVKMFNLVFLVSSHPSGSSSTVSLLSGDRRALRERFAPEYVAYPVLGAPSVVLAVVSTRRSELRLWKDVRYGRASPDSL